MRIVSIGDSFTEGIGDERPDGTVRGWADLVATGLALDIGEPVEYANLAIRGKLMAQIVREQLEPALALEPTVLTLNGGGNDMLRPRADVARICSLTEHVITRCHAVGVRPLILSGGNPARNLPMGRRMQRLGDLLTTAVEELTIKHDVMFTNMWADAELTHAAYWCDDRLHLNAAGHHRVAAHVLQTLGAAYPEEWMLPAASGPALAPGLAANAAYYRQHVLPWIRRRLTRRSSGDGRQPKYIDWRAIEPDA
ncbi:SGNH/GDSL hydrolase family protein [Phytoactinopolyspora alkaliphila]|uniref:SGNH/GDSL hydrolase family protein n=1 Tax=Phytoactinopolyspora alkaliphila TaxID=1783498 RepID=A0A6N9YMC9_9ACTN|nr:SGNH/GDSL hydrolase family protein [Phytoactinopolyspora alkaliphila]NED96105.1 SGNH/GDSL hydrolase family protein [Phytoactinopolyspora alkaliphila]